MEDIISVEHLAYTYPSLDDQPGVVVFGAKYGGKTEAGELGLPVKESGLILPCGATGRWTP